MERVLSAPEYAAQRVPALQEARGRVLEVGFGFGGSLGSYPGSGRRISSLVGLEPNPGMLRRAERHAAEASFPVELVRATAEAIPFPDATFDCVVSNWTLCSLANLPAALREIGRVLEPGGRFLFLEHGRADDPRLWRRQRRFSPVHSFFAGGCRLDVPIDAVIREAGFGIQALVRYEGRPGPRFLMQMYRGVAVRAAVA
jgi:ubiquinone/menaquinone biosynthesis C-methylase UbiE